MDTSGSSVFRVAGAVIICRALYSLFLRDGERNVELGSREEHNVGQASNPDKTRKCALCLNARTNTASTECGHLYCWSCIVPWLETKPECPLCGNAATPSKLMYAVNV